MSNANPKAAWKGVLLIGPLAVPVRLVNAIAGDARVHFHQAHRCTQRRLTRINMKRWCAHCARELAMADVLRVYDSGAGDLVISNDDLATCEAPESVALEVTTVVDELVDPAYVAGVHHLVADGPEAALALEATRRALGTRMAVGRIVLQKRSQTVAIHADATVLTVYTLRAHRHVRDPRALEMPEAPAVRADDVRLVAAALDQLGSHFHYANLVDAYDDAVGAMVDAKVAKKAARRSTAA